MVRKLVVLATTLTAATGLAACGADEQTPEEEVREAATRMFGEQDANVMCKERITARFVKEAYGSTARCVKSGKEQAEEQGDGRLGRITVQGARANVGVTITEGKAKGGAGTFRLVKEQDTWKLDGYGEDFLRSMLGVSVEAADSEGILTYEPLSTCFGKAVTKLEGDKLKGFIYGPMRGEKQETSEKFLKLMSTACDRAFGMAVGTQLYTRLVEAGGIPKSLSKDCMTSQMGFALWASGLADDALMPSIQKDKDKDALTAAALAGIVKGARSNCLKKTSSAS